MLEGASMEVANSCCRGPLAAVSFASARCIESLVGVRRRPAAAAAAAAAAGANVTSARPSVSIRACSTTERGGGDKRGGGRKESGGEIKDKQMTNAATRSNQSLDLPNSTTDRLQNWPLVCVSLLGLGFLLGPLLDGIHSNVQLQLYDNGAIDIGPLHTNVVVPPLLAVFYSVAGMLQLALDKWLSQTDQLPKASLRRLIFSFVFLIVILELSAELYKAGVPYNIEAYVLFALAEINWVLFDGTWWGFGLAALVGAVCPLAEVPIMNLYGVWHYPKANVEIYGQGLVTWVLACYFSYMPFIANLSRYLSVQINLRAARKPDE